MLTNSLSSDAPARLKKELDSVLVLQSQADALTTAIASAESAFSDGHASSESQALVANLRRAHSELTDRIELLYSSLNVEDSFPELKGYDLLFVRTLILARDLKINIRKRALGSFFEWSRIDQAVGGKDQALGKFIIILLHTRPGPLAIFCRHQISPAV